MHPNPEKPEIREVGTFLQRERKSLRPFVALKGTF
jgi:hypothetical protein